MPRLLNTDTEEQHKIGTGAFSFRGTRIDRLVGASEYTLATIAVDDSGSVYEFADELRKMLVMAVEACRKSPRPENLLIRALTFSDRYKGGVNEIHGFKLLSEIDTSAYPAITPGGGTPLCDAVYSSVGASNTYGKQLLDQEYGVNAICFIITDGGENTSTATMAMVKREIAKSLKGETLESMITVLIGINAAECKDLLERFKQEAGITEYRDAGDATPQNLAKLAGFVSRSVSSQSQALGTGGPSQNIAATI